MPSRGLTGAFMAAVALMLVLGLALAAQPGEKKAKEMPAMKGRIMAMSKYPFNETVSQLKRAIEEQGLMVVFTADHQAMLQMVGMQTKGMQGIEFFHPKYGKVIAQNDHMAGIEIPFRLMVMEGDMGTMLSYDKPSHVFGKYPKLKALGRELDGVVEKIAQAVTK